MAWPWKASESQICQAPCSGILAIVLVGSTDAVLTGKPVAVCGSLGGSNPVGFRFGSVTQGPDH